MKENIGKKVRKADSWLGLNCVIKDIGKKVRIAHLW